jgi:hypothetical protein
MELQLETVSTSTLLGIRFWDPARDVQVADSLIVTARPAAPGSPKVGAFTTASGVYAFQGLSGMRGIENGLLEESFSAPQRDFIIEVDDRQRRFLPVAFRVALPLRSRGLYLPAGSPPGGEHHGFFLFSAPTRTPHPGMAVVRAWLVEAAGAPAAHAFIEVEAGGDTWYGIADARGMAVVMFPYPLFTGVVGASPPGPPPALQEWRVNVRVGYRPSVLSFPSEGTLPDLASVFRQHPALMLDGGGNPLSEIHCTLSFGRELVLRSGRESALRIREG